ncbi:MAG: BtrH N-terminal domain-containing protein [Bdellovibrionales bacterium]|nr:BtrH N-terminal domain-containing protein [Bdellovibrionales bacterium]
MTSKMIIKHKLFEGQHCETVATGNLLYQQGLCLSESMMFGLGEGFGFIFLNLSSLNLPFIGGRSKPFSLTEKLCANLNIQLDAYETSSKGKALEYLYTPIQNGNCVGLQLDSYYLDYFTNKIHFAGHFVAVYGVDGDNILLIDTKQQGGRQKTSIANIEKARFAKGVMAAKARTWTVTVSKTDINLSGPIKKAIRNNASDYLNPAFKGMSFLGIEKLAKSLPKWIQIAKNPQVDLALSAMLMERAGTGGSIFRCFYRDFLKESFDILGTKKIEQGFQTFKGIADDWKEVSSLIERAGKDDSVEPLIKASVLCTSLAQREKSVMELLSSI